MCESGLGVGEDVQSCERRRTLALLVGWRGRGVAWRETRLEARPSEVGLAAEVRD